MYRGISIAFLILAGALSLTACTDAGLTALNAAAQFGEYRRTANIPYGALPRNRLDIYAPQGVEAGSRPSVVFFYGGDPGRLFVMGHSAGAHIAAMLAFDDAHLENAVYREIRGFIGLAGPYDFLPLDEAYQRALFGPEDRYPLSQPINFIDGSEPAMLLLHGDADDTVKPRNLVNLAARVKQVNGAVETRRYKDVDHGMIVAALAWPLRDSYPVFADIRAFIDRRAGTTRAARTVSQRTE